MIDEINAGRENTVNSTNNEKRTGRGIKFIQ